MPTIQFQTEYKGFDLKQKTAVKNWLKAVIAGEKFELGELAIVFCDDQYLLKVNQEYLAHDYFTDIITFDYCQAGDKKRSGDLIISIDRVKDNAQQEKVAFEKELHRVLVHGVLHLCGYKDKKPADKLAMRKREDKWLKVLAKS